MALPKKEAAPTTTHPASSAPDRRSNAPLFVALWALYFLVHELKQAPWPADVGVPLMVVRVLIVASALATLHDPYDVRRFVAMLLLQIASVLIELPGMSNCWLFTGLLGVGLAGAHLEAFRRHGRGTTVESVYEIYAPAARVALLTMYGFAALAKYNTDFFDDKASCAALFYRVFAASASLPAIPWMSSVSVIGTIAAETALPIFLYPKATRRYAIVFGMAFHTVLAHNPNIAVYDFNAMLFALYVTFAPADFFAALRPRPSIRSAFWVARRRVPVFVALTLVSVLLVWVTSRTGHVDSILGRYRIGLWFLIGAMMTIVAATTLLSREGAPTADLEAPYRIGDVAGWVAVLLVALNGAAPYLGLKTGVAYSMFSNLRTERGYENHLFMPAAMKLFGYQDVSVRVLQSSAAELSEGSSEGERLVLHDLRMRAARHPDASLVYEIDGVVRQAARVADDPLVGAPPSFLERKLLYFRTVQSGRRSCQW